MKQKLFCIILFLVVPHSLLQGMQEELETITNSAKQPLDSRQAPRAAVVYTIAKKGKNTNHKPLSTHGTIITYDEHHFSVQQPLAKMQISNLLNPRE